MKTIATMLVCGLIGIGHARPVIIEESAVLPLPGHEWDFFGRFGVAIDGDFALVSGERYVGDPDTGMRHEGTAFLYRRSDTGEWTYQGRLGPIVVIPEGTHPGLAMNDGIAVTVTDRWRIWERPEINEQLTDTFVLAPVAGIAPDAFQGLDIEVDSGQIMIVSADCATTNVLRRFDGTWKVAHQLPVDAASCDRAGISQDIHQYRAAVFNVAGPDGSLPPHVVTYRREQSGTVYVPSYAAISGQRSTLLGPPLALMNPFLAVSGVRERYGTLVTFESLPSQNVYLDAGLMPVDGYLQPTPGSATAIERAGLLFAQRNYSHDYQTHVINMFARIGEDNSRFAHVATLLSREGRPLGPLFDHSQRRIIVNGWAENGDNIVRVFELPPSFGTPAVQFHDFELAAEGALWERTAGSTFSIVNVAKSNVFRQASTSGNPAAFLPSGPTGNQAIQVDVTPRAIMGANAWVGLMTRRQDDTNYYYVTLRSGSVLLKRMAGGEFMTIGGAPANLKINHRYRLRFESIGQTHRVYIDDKRMATARDDTHAQGSVGLMTNRAAADYDNVIVTPSPLTSIYRDDFSTPNNAWQFVPGPRWFANDGVFRPEGIADHARTVTGAATLDQIVQVRIRPISFNEPNNWVGVLLRWRDERNHAYVSLHGRNVIALWRRTNGAIQQLTTARLTITPGAWHTVRVEHVGGHTRVYVNSWLVLESDADLGPAGPDAVGQSGVTAYRAMADFDDFVAYQP